MSVLYVKMCGLYTISNRLPFYNGHSRNHCIFEVCPESAGHHARLLQIKVFIHSLRCEFNQLQRSGAVFSG